MAHQCPKDGRPVIVAYMHRGVRHVYAACSHCDSLSLWPNFAKTSPPLPKE